ncbi:Splicing factor 3B subunit 2 [Sparganum proliferum]
MESSVEESGRRKSTMQHKNPYDSPSWELGEPPLQPQSWTRALDDRHEVHIAFIDFQKAFDTVPHQRLLHKLKKIGIGDNFLKWIENFLLGRHQVVCIGQGKSDPAMVESGVPQGSVLGPILFLIYVDDAARALDCEVAMFADDMKIWSVIRGPADEDILQVNLNRLEEWSSRWLLRFNVAGFDAEVRLKSCVAMAILENQEPADGDSLSESGQRFLTRQQERNRKKRSKKKAAKQRRKQTNPDETLSSLQYPSKTSSQKSSDDEDEELPVFELKGAFERFKLVFEDETEKGEGAEGAADGSTNGASSTTSKSISHPDINLKARTAALLAEEAAAKASAQAAAAAAASESKKKKEEEGEAPAPLSKKKLKLLNRPSVASLKQAVSRPDVVEMWDVCARDPLLLVYLKSYRNTVPVPKHWCAKRKYLQGKRGFEKPPFRLPEFIARTGIMEMRQAITEKVSGHHCLSGDFVLAEPVTLLNFRDWRFPRGLSEEQSLN